LVYYAVMLLNISGNIIQKDNDKVPITYTKKITHNATAKAVLEIFL